MSSTRAPALTARGRLLLITAAILLIAGAALGIWALVGFGLVVLAVVSTAYLAFFPTALLIWRRHIEFAWKLPRRRRGRPEGGEGGAEVATGTLVAGRPFPVQLTLRNRAPLHCGIAQLHILASSTVTAPVRAESASPAEAGTLMALRLGARADATLVAEVRASVAGYWFLHGAALELVDRLGVAAVRAYFSSPLALRVMPRALARGRTNLQRPAGASDERIGRHALRLLGIGGELRELRDHVPGDPFKHIAWKATARTGRLMVRELDREARVAHYLLVDIGGSMREGAPERSKLNHVVELAAEYARAVLDSGDRVGLITFDGRIHRHLRPDDRAPTWNRIAERLMDAMHPVDPDFTEVTDGELVATVARYLRHQEAFDARLTLAPAIDDPRWSHVATGPDGVLYDLAALGQVVERLLVREFERGVPRPEVLAPSPATPADDDLLRLRRFCRVRGIELACRRTQESGGRARGMAEALELAARQRGPLRVIILSDIAGFDGGMDRLSRTIALSRRRGHKLACAAPLGIAYAMIPATAAGRRAAEILGWDEKRRAEAARQQFERLGIHVVTLLPRDRLPTLLARLARRSGTVRPM